MSDARAAASIEDRLRRVEDELAIRRILVDYLAFLDARDLAAYVELFAPDGEWTNPGGSYRGRAAIRQMMAGAGGSADTPNRSFYHMSSNARIDVEGDRATAISRFLFVMRGPDGRPLPSLAGTYHDEFVRLDGEWKISRRVADDVIPSHEEWLRLSAAGSEGR